ncbi:MAG: hypothetical protein ABIZ50_03120, partial [Solirubrobacterales bacterium]
MPERIRLISFVGGTESYGVLVGGEDGSQAALVGPDWKVEATSSVPMEEGRVALDSEAGEPEISWSPAGPLLEFAIGDDGVRVHAIAASAGGVHPLSGPGVHWDLPAAGHSAIRTAWAATAKGDLTVLIAARPEDSREHGEEIVGAARLIPGAEPYGYVEPLLSTEYDAAGLHTRATLELWTDLEDHAPERAGGQRIAGARLDSTAGRLEAARFRW